MTDAGFGVDLSASELRVDGSTTETAYEVRDRDGTTLLRVRREQARDEYTFEDARGEPVFAVRNGDALGTDGDYALVDETTERPVVTLTESASAFHQNWTVEDLDGGPESVHVGGVELPGFLDWLTGPGQKLSVADSAGNVLGYVSSRNSGTPTATIEVGDADDVRRQAVVAAAVAIAVLRAD